MRINKTPIPSFSIEGCWNSLSTLERVQMILTHSDHFLYQGLITEEELEKARHSSQTEWEYVIEREEQPLFHNLNLKKEMRSQQLRQKLKTALNAVFLKFKIA